MLSKSGLYLPRTNRGQFTRAEDIWVLGWASDCQDEWRKGFHGLVCNGFELEPVDFDLWDDYKDLPEFSELRSFVDAVEGEVKTSLIHETHVLAEVQGPLYQEHTVW